MGSYFKQPIVCECGHKGFLRLCESGHMDSYESYWLDATPPRVVRCPNSSRDCARCPFSTSNACRRYNCSGVNLRKSRSAASGPMSAGARHSRSQ
jgi:hypothetical protein